MIIDELKSLVENSDKYKEYGFSAHLGSFARLGEFVVKNSELIYKALEDYE